MQAQTMHDWGLVCLIGFVVSVARDRGFENGARRIISSKGDGTYRIYAYPCGLACSGACPASPEFEWEIRFAGLGRSIGQELNREEGNRGTNMTSTANRGERTVQR
jgi:hypothetical protein